MRDTASIGTCPRNFIVGCMFSCLTQETLALAKDARNLVTKSRSCITTWEGGLMPRNKRSPAANSLVHVGNRKFVGML